MAKPPWITGPGEILQHGLSLLGKDSDKNRRLAILSIDNAVELTIKTYLSLPRRVTGINLSRKDYLEINESFPRLLDAIEQHSSDKLNGIDLGEIEWFHRLRNELYHQGNGLTVEREKVEVYAELAKLLFKNLFGFDVEVEETPGHEMLGRFLEAWVGLERTIAILATKHTDKMSEFLRMKAKKSMLSYDMAIPELKKLGVIDDNIYAEISNLRRFRNGIIHGEVEAKRNMTPEMVKRIETLEARLEKL